jgi:hypothetical protein
MIKSGLAFVSTSKRTNFWTLVRVSAGPEAMQQRRRSGAQRNRGAAASRRLEEYPHVLVLVLKKVSRSRTHVDSCNYVRQFKTKG